MIRLQDFTDLFFFPSIFLGVCFYTCSNRCELFVLFFFFGGGRGMYIALFGLLSSFVFKVDEFSGVWEG